MDILNNEVFLIVISGVFIFALQKLVSDIWINPNIDFNKSLTRIETLLIKSKSLYRWTYKKNNLVSSSGLPMDSDIENLRKEINIATWELISTYNSLFFAEKLWLKLIGISVNKARPSLMTLSITVCSENDWNQPDGRSLSEKEMDNIYKQLKFWRYFTEFL